MSLGQGRPMPTEIGALSGSVSKDEAQGKSNDEAEDDSAGNERNVLSLFGAEEGREPVHYSARSADAVCPALRRVSSPADVQPSRCFSVSLSLMVPPSINAVAATVALTVARSAPRSRLYRHAQWAS